MTPEACRKTFLITIYLLCIPVVVLLTRYVLVRSVTVAETAHADTTVSTGAFEVSLLEGDGQDADVLIPLPPGVSQDDVVFENRYLEHACYITIAMPERGFYLDRPVTCDTEKVSGVTCFLHGNDTIGLRLNTRALYEPSFRLENDTIRVALKKPAETAAHVIVVDPVYGGAGGDVSLALAKKLRETLLSSPLSCYVYITRTDEVSPADEAVFALVEESGASRYIRLTMPVGEAALAASLSFDDSFFIRGYGNVPYSADVMRALSAVENLRADGIRTVSDDARLSNIRIPAVSVHIEGVRSSFGEDEKLISELALALGTAFRIGFQSAE